MIIKIELKREELVKLLKNTVSKTLTGNINLEDIIIGMKENIENEISIVIDKEI